MTARSQYFGMCWTLFRQAFLKPISCCHFTAENNPRNLFLKDRISNSTARTIHSCDGLAQYVSSEGTVQTIAP
jgi:hypothetical protein